MIGPTKNTAKTLVKFSRDKATVIAVMPTAINTPLIHANGLRNTFKLFLDIKGKINSEPSAKRAQAIK